MARMNKQINHAPTKCIVQTRNEIQRGIDLHCIFFFNWQPFFPSRDCIWCGNGSSLKFVKTFRAIFTKYIDINRMIRGLK